jgi:hypothetical protein
LFAGSLAVRRFNTICFDAGTTAVTKACFNSILFFLKIVSLRVQTSYVPYKTYINAVLEKKNSV